MTQQTNPTGPEKQSSVLVIDGEVQNLAAIAEILGEDCDLIAAGDGLGAIEVAKQKKPDLILLDASLPGIDGFEVLTALKRAPETCEIPVILLSGLGGVAGEEKGLSLGAADYISKPLAPAILRLRVKNQLDIVNRMRLKSLLSEIDTLTHTANRRHLNTYLNQEWQRAIRDKTHISALMLDVDRFKDYNDTYGHIQGDRALQALASILKQKAKRSVDLVARWGGEEFLIVLPGTGIKGALVVAEGIRAEIEKSVFPGGDGSPTRLSASIGVNSTIPVPGSSKDAFISGADKALYHAKQTGRNRVCTAAAGAMG